MPKGQRSASASKASEDVLSGTAASSSDDAAVALEMSLLADEPRRSERVRRDKPDYYDALEYEKKRAAAASDEPECIALSSDEDGDEDEDGSETGGECG